MPSPASQRYTLPAAAGIASTDINIRNAAAALIAGSLPSSPGHYKLLIVNAGRPVDGPSPLDCTTGPDYPPRPGERA